ncbi:rab-like protein 3 [Drosophila albomicans]|uniref:Rab-like protein 3 n=1 Tax=Drosophila albomicans TaxID=7291 RepID=A0A6P8WHL3_DROAB|nr:rab-like protein 3 [Drosophila albomicans]
MNNRVRIVIVGDSGVGKTCLTHLIAHNESLIRPGWTVGCNIQVKIHEFKEATVRQCPYFIELFDIGGSLSHKNTRSAFYTGIHGVILVHDLTNGKSQEQLLDWLYEIVNKEGKDTYKSRSSSSMPPSPTASTLPSFVGGISEAHMRFDLEEFLGSTQIPILVMGTKLDLIDEKRHPKTAVKKAGGIADKCGAEEIWLNCRDTRSLAAGTTDAVKLSRFFDCVIEKRESSAAGAHHMAAAAANATIERRRPPNSSSSNNSQPTSSPEYANYTRLGRAAGGPAAATDSGVPLLETSDLK